MKPRAIIQAFFSLRTSLFLSMPRCRAHRLPKWLLLQCWGLSLHRSPRGRGPLIIPLVRGYPECGHGERPQVQRWGSRRRKPTTASAPTLNSMASRAIQGSLPVPRDVLMTGLREPAGEAVGAILFAASVGLRSKRRSLDMIHLRELGRVCQRSEFGEVAVVENAGDSVASFEHDEAHRAGFQVLAVVAWPEGASGSTGDRG